MKISLHQPMPRPICFCCIRPINKPEAKPLPVKGVSIATVINQDIASVMISQTFINTDKKPIEVEYVFPIPSSASLSSLKIYTQGKVIEAQVKELEEAKEVYGDALASGDNAFMAQISSLEDVATLQIGYIKSQAEVRVEITYAVECKFDRERWKLIIPINLIPRYNSSEKITRADTGQIWTFSCELNTNAQARDIKCNFKKHTIEQASETCLVIKTSGIDLPDKDIAISYTTSQVSQPFALVQRDARTNALGIHFSFQPPTVEASLEDFDPSGEFILLLDRSGSMRGNPIETAKQAVQLFIKSLPEKSLFNIVSFGSGCSPMFPASKPYSIESIENAISSIKIFNADMGGTEIYTPLMNILKTEPNSSFPRYVFLITDGGVGNVQAIVDLVEENRKNTRVSTIGIGSGASSELIEKVAEAGKGSSTLILEINSIKQGVLSSLEKALKPTLNDVTIEWLSGEVITQHPSKPFYAFNGDRLAFNAVLQDVGVPIAFRVNYHDSLSDERKSLEFGNDLSEIKSGNESIALAVKGAVGTDDEVRLAVMFQILTKRAALIATCRGDGEAMQAEPTMIKVGLRNKLIPNYEANISFGYRGGRGGIQFKSHAMPRGVRGGIQLESHAMPRKVETGFASSRPGSSTSSLSVRNSALPLKAKSSAYAPSRHDSSISTSSARDSRKMSKKNKTKHMAEGCEDSMDYEDDESILTSSSSAPQSSQAELLINVQNPDGSWASSAELERLLTSLGIRLEAVIARHSAFTEAVLVTALVCAVLAERLREFEGTWKLAASKGVRWLRKQGAQKMTLSELLG